jgi:hypothetical protein
MAQVVLEHLTKVFLGSGGGSVRAVDAQRFDPATGVAIEQEA